MTEDFAGPDPAKLVEAVIDVCWKATPMYLPDGEDVNYYMVPKGALHRLVGVGQQFGSVALRNGKMDAAIKAKLEAGKPEDAELIATNQLLRVALRIAYDDMEAMYQAVQAVPRRHMNVAEDDWEKGVFEGQPTEPPKLTCGHTGAGYCNQPVDGITVALCAGCTHGDGLGGRATARIIADRSKANG
jgi:hypothetical protein